MTERDFVYWLQGFAELNAEPPTVEQWKSIREHLATVFVKITPAVHPSPLIPSHPMLRNPAPIPLADPYWPQPPVITC